MSFRFLEHTADVRMEVLANSYEELFFEALKGLAEFVAPEACKQEKNFLQDIHLQANSYEELLVDFLSEVLFFLETRWILFCEISFRKLSENELAGTLRGTEIQNLEEHVKAITYEDLKIEKTSEGFSVEITLDI